MGGYISDVAFTPEVKNWQSKYGSRQSYERMAQNRDWQRIISPSLKDFIAQVDSFYLASSNSVGQPYIQHRGGPPGFLKVLDHEYLAFADYGGNKQYITAGNLSENNKVHIFLMDYFNKTRIKIWGEAQIIGQDDNLSAIVMDNGYAAKIERIILIKVKAWDLNCPQHIRQKYSQDQLDDEVRTLKARIKELEEKLKEKE